MQCSAVPDNTAPSITNSASGWWETTGLEEAEEKGRKKLQSPRPPEALVLQATLFLFRRRQPKRGGHEEAAGAGGTLAGRRWAFGSNRHQCGKSVVKGW